MRVILCRRRREIGEVIRPWTTLGPYQEPKPIETRLALCGLAPPSPGDRLVIIQVATVRNPVFLVIGPGACR